MGSKETDQYTITLTRRQAQIIQRALNLYLRLGLGQIDELRRVLLLARFEPSLDNYAKINRLLNEVKLLFTGFSYGASRGISSADLPVEFKEACDIHDVIRHRVSWDISPEGGIGVNFYEPFRHSDSPLPTIKRSD